MSNSICNFMPAKSHTGNIKTVHFVYESDFHTLRQPFLRPIFYAHLVTGGKATLHVYDQTYDLASGTLFFSFPAVPFTIEGSEDFKYLYISFMGSGVPALLETFGIGIKSPVYCGLEHMIDFWMSSITRINQKNANLLSEGVLFCTLSLLSEQEENNSQSKPENLFEMLIDYVDTHYRDPDLSLKKLSTIFSYTEKYVSHLFKQKTGIGLNRYLGDLRLRYAYELLAAGTCSVSEIAAHCGYSDPLYFSKVFKKRTGLTPTEYMERS